jgi:hypothetical protein
MPPLKPQSERGYLQGIWGDPVSWRPQKTGEAFFLAGFIVSLSFGVFGFVKKKRYYCFTYRKILQIRKLKIMVAGMLSSGLKKLNDPISITN